MANSCKVSWMKPLFKSTAASIFITEECLETGNHPTSSFSLQWLVYSALHKRSLHHKRGHWSEKANGNSQHDVLPSPCFTVVMVFSMFLLSLQLALWLITNRISYAQITVVLWTASSIWAVELSNSFRVTLGLWVVLDYSPDLLLDGFL